MALEELGGNSARNLRDHLTAIENMEAEKKGIADDIGDRFKLAKDQGYDPKVMKELIRRRKVSDDERELWDAAVETYEAAVKSADIAPSPLMKKVRQAVAETTDDTKEEVAEEVKPKTRAKKAAPAAEPAPSAENDLIAEALEPVSDDAFEASPEELAQQRDRQPTVN